MARMRLILGMLPLSAGVALALGAAPAASGGNVNLSQVQFSLGSLIATGSVTGVGGYSAGIRVELAATGTPVVTCTSPGGKQAPGRNPSRISAAGTEFVGPQDITKKGKAPLSVTAETTSITGRQGGCPNDSWKAEIVFVFWTSATISIYDAATGALLLRTNYVCTTIRFPPSVSCTPAQ